MYELLKAVADMLSAHYGVTTAVTCAITTLIIYRLFRTRKPADTLIKLEVQEIPEEVHYNKEGFLLFVDDSASAFGAKVTTSKDILVESGEFLYYFVSGSVEILKNHKIVMVKEQDMFLTTPQWLSNPAARSAISYRIRPKSIFYRIPNWRNEQILRLLYTRFFRGTLYTLFNYLEIPPEAYDIKKINVQLSSEPRKLLSEVQKQIELGRKVAKYELVENLEEIAGDSLVLVLKGNPTVIYKNREVEVGPGSLVGCINRTSFLTYKRKIKGACALLEIFFSPSGSQTLSYLNRELEEYISSPVSELIQLTGSMVDWRILQPGEKISSEIPSKSVKIISCGYFLKGGDVKYFGIGSGKILFEKEVILGRESPYVAIAARISEIIEVPPQYVDLVVLEYQSYSPSLYKEILNRTGAEEMLDPPRIITFVPNSPRTTQVEIFTQFLSMEIGKSDRCTVLSSSELLKMVGVEEYTPRWSVTLICGISSLLQEYSYVLLPVTSEHPDISRELAMKMSEMLFYATVNGDQKEVSLGKVWCKIDTVVLHRDSRRKVLRGKYYGQRHHVEFPSIDVPVSVFRSKTEEIKMKRKSHCTFTEDFQRNTFPTFPTKDLERFLRTLRGEGVGLVLGGGGARGIAHIGVIQALEEAGVPIDAVGGTSMGAFVGALYAEACNNRDVFVISKRICSMIGSVWRVLLDMTYPICSMFTGKSFNWALQLTFKSKKIEDLWLPYYCVTTDISEFEEKVHRSGIVWRYVRASMSLSGYLPPLCDKGSFLLDGGYMNNVPADAMRYMGIRNIIAVDVGSEVESNYDQYGDSLNGFYILFQKLFGTKKYLSLTEIQYRLAYLSSTHKERSLRSDVTVKYIRPELGTYKTMNFRQFDEIVAHGYEHGKKVVAEWKKQKNADLLSSPWEFSKK